jgi:hypothetical protein
MNAQYNQTVIVLIPFVIRKQTLVFCAWCGWRQQLDEEQIAAPCDREASRSAKREGIGLRQNYRRVAKRARRQLKFLHTRLGCVAPLRSKPRSEITVPWYKSVINLSFSWAGVPWAG